jgi:RND family efflux transporter MFP subunit
MTNSAYLFKTIIKIAIAFLIIIFTVVAIKVAVLTKPIAKKRPIKKMVPVVEVTNIEPQKCEALVEAMGTIKPAKTIVLKTRVKGQIVSLHPHFAPGTNLQKGEFIAQIDKTDYTINVTSSEANLIKARTELQLEYGRQNIAKHEWKLLKNTEGFQNVDNSLALRKPQLKYATATVKAAEIALNRAKLDLERTTIIAPFAATIVTTDVNEGDQADLQTKLATLLATDVYWAELSISVKKLKWLKIPGVNAEQGSEVEILSQDGLKSSGHIIKLLPDLHTKGRMARVLVEIKKPTRITNEHRRPLLIGEFIQAHITGKGLGKVVKIPRLAFKNNREIWLLTSKNTLKIEPINALWEDQDFIYTDSELDPTDQLITNGLTLPIIGMSLQRTTSDKDFKNE